MIKGFKNFLLRGDVVVIAVGLVIASGVQQPDHGVHHQHHQPAGHQVSGQPFRDRAGLSARPGQQQPTFLNIGALISAIIYFVVFVAVVYFVIVVPYRTIQRRRGITVFGDPPPVKTCPACLSADLPVAATRCKYCAIDLPTATDAAV